MPRLPNGYIVISTLGDHIDERYTIRYYCAAYTPGKGYCRGSGLVDLEALAARLGRDHGALARDLQPHVFCERCGGNDVTFRISPPDLPTGEGGHGPSRATVR